MKFARRPHALIAAVLATVVMAASACSGTGSGERSGAVELTYWTWSPATASAVEVWNKNHPTIHVKTVDMGRANEQSAKLLAAARAGNGPDLFQAEYSSLATYVVNKVALDISDEAVKVRAAFSESIWNQVDLGGKIYGLPVDSAPMVLFYDSRIFQQLGIAVPKTWEEFRAAAAAIHTARPGTTMTIFPTNYAGFFTGVSGQRAPSWWGLDGSTWSVDIDNAPSQQVASYWSSLIQDRLVSAQPYWTADFNQLIASGSVATFPIGVWHQNVLASLLKGKALSAWRIAPLPKWDPADPVGVMGGSAVSVSTGSQHQVEATEFARWLSADPDASSALASGGEYPSTVAGQKALTGSPVSGLAAGQKDYFNIVAAASNDVTTATWGPDSVSVFTSFLDAMGRALEESRPLTDVLRETQEYAVKDLKSAGYTVNG